jgi:hypothetical protein
MGTLGVLAREVEQPPEKQGPQASSGISPLHSLHQALGKLAWGVQPMLSHAGYQGAALHISTQDHTRDLSGAAALVCISTNMQLVMVQGRGIYPRLLGKDRDRGEQEQEGL